MSVNPVSQRFPFDAQLAEQPEGVVAAHRYAFSGIVDLNQAIASLKLQMNAMTPQATPSTTASTTTNITGVANFNGAAGSVTYYPYLGFVNDQTGNVAYTTQTTDSGALIILSNAATVSLVLNFAVAAPWFTNVINEGTGIVTITATSGTINGGASLTLLPKYFATIYFDGINWEAATLPTVPVSIASVAHLWLNSYSAATGAFTQSQPAFADVSGQIASSQLPASGLSVTMTTAKLTTAGTQGSQTFTNGILTAQVQAT